MAENKKIEKEKEHEKKKKAPRVSLMLLLPAYFLFYVLFFVFYNILLTNSIHAKLADLTLYLDDSNGQYQNSKDDVNHIVNKFRFIFFLIISLFFLVSNMMIYVFYLNGSRKLYALKIIGACILLIIGPMFLLCNSSPFVKIFENSIGYMIARFISFRSNESFSTFMKNLFTHTSFQDIDFTFVFSLFTLNNFGTLLHDIGTKRTESNFYINPTYATQENIKHLLDAVIRKNTIGHMCWIYFTTIASSLIAIKYTSRYL